MVGAHSEMPVALPRRHNDPFDHIIAAQAMAEPMRLITGNNVLSQYTPLALLI